MPLARNKAAGCSLMFSLIFQSNNILDCGIAMIIIIIIIIIMIIIMIIIIIKIIMIIIIMTPRGLEIPGWRPAGASLSLVMVSRKKHWLVVT